MKIAVGAARGIAHIHRQDAGKLVHGNIKSSNIFLNGQQYGIVSDAGLAKLMTPIRRSVMRTLAHFAPEVKDTSNVSQASDVYSFGVVLLELVSGRPSQITSGNGEVISIVKWIQSVVRDEWTTKVFDLELLRYDNEEEAIVQLLQIAMNCVNIIPERRPRMSEVEMMLEEISEMDTGEQPCFQSRLEDLLPGLTP